MPQTPHTEKHFTASETVTACASEAGVGDTGLTVVSRNRRA
jgi:hypothetical protein